MNNLDELEKLAKAVDPGDRELCDCGSCDNSKFHLAANPVVVLELIKVIREAKETVVRLQAGQTIEHNYGRAQAFKEAAAIVRKDQNDYYGDDSDVFCKLAELIEEMK